MSSSSSPAPSTTDPLEQLRTLYGPEAPRWALDILLALEECKVLLKRYAPLIGIATAAAAFVSTRLH